MPALSSDSAIRSPSSADDTSAPLAANHHHHPPNSRKSHDRTSIGSAFVWTTEANGENGHVDTSSDFLWKSGSLQSLPPAGTYAANGAGNGGAGSGGMPGGDKTLHSRGGSSLSLERLPSREKPSRQNGWVASSSSLPTAQDEHQNRHNHAESYPLPNGVTDSASMVNGTSSAPPNKSSMSRAGGVNGDASSSDVPRSADLTSITSMVSSPPAMDGSATTLTQPQPTNHQRQTSPSRFSFQPEPSDAAVFASSSSSVANTQNSHNPQSHRPLSSTLQVPRLPSGRRSSRDSSIPDDRGSLDRISSPTSGIRRGSLNLSRRLPRSASDGTPEEGPRDEDAARWTEAIKQRRASKRKRREEEDDERVIVGTKVDQNHVNWVTAYNMLTGIRFTVSRTNAKLDRELVDADFDAKHKFSFDITGNELTPSAKYDFKFKDYAPWVFRHLRAKFKLDPADYLVSLTSKYILSELGSPGKSGSFFYFSRDYKYIIKTIHHAEHKLLRRILRDYYQHIENNPNTLISQFYGLHRVKIPYGRKIHFVVMNNLFPPHRDIHHMFDLKGSTIGRDFREDDVEKNPRATLKDLNWMRRDRRLELGPMKRDVLIAQLRRDVALLTKLKIMDYSLLIGIHDVQKGNEEKLRDRTLQVFQPGAELPEDQQSNLLARTPSRLESIKKARELREIIKREKPVPMERTAARMPDEILDERKNLVFYSDDGGFRATHEDGEPAGEIYYLGVIDCLTSYGTVKKMEHFWKGLSHNRNQISPVPPESYGQRFLNFITGVTKSKEETVRESQTVDRARGSVSETVPSPTATTQPPPSQQLQQQQQQQQAVDRTMEKAEKAAAKSCQTLAEDPEPRERVLSTVRASAPEAPGTGGPSTLPVVEEIGETGNGSSEKSPGPTASGGLTDEMPEPPSYPPPPPPSQSQAQSHPLEERLPLRVNQAPPGPPPQRLPPSPPLSSSSSRADGGPVTSSNSTSNGRTRDKSEPANVDISTPPSTSTPRVPALPPQRKSCVTSS